MTKNFLNLSLGDLLPNSWVFTPRKFKVCILLSMGSYFIHSFSLSSPPLPPPSPPPPPPSLPSPPPPSPPSSPPPSLSKPLLEQETKVTALLVNACIIQRSKENCVPISDIFCFPPIFINFPGMTLSNEDTRTAEPDKAKKTQCLTGEIDPCTQKPTLELLPSLCLHFRPPIKHLWAGG